MAETSTAQLEAETRRLMKVDQRYRTVGSHNQKLQEKIRGSLAGVSQAGKALIVGGSPSHDETALPPLDADARWLAVRFLRASSSATTESAEAAAQASRRCRRGADPIPLLIGYLHAASRVRATHLQNDSVGGA